MFNPKTSKKPYEIKNQLHKFSKEDLGLVNCFSTPTGKLVIQCKDTQRLENFKNLIESTEEIKENLQISVPRPRRLKLIIFGAPKALSQKKGPNAETNQQQQIEQYLTDFIMPAIQNALHNDSDDSIYRLTNIINAGKDRSHLVGEMDENNARSLLRTGKVLIGFFSCRIQRYVNIIRCFNCQGFHHTANQCKYPPTCGVCGRDHKTGGLKTDDMPMCSRKPHCVNCEAEMAIDRDDFGSRSTLKLSLSHRTWDKSKCYSYKKQLDFVKSKLDQNLTN